MDFPNAGDRPTIVPLPSDVDCELSIALHVALGLLVVAAAAIVVMGVGSIAVLLVP